MSIEYYVNMEKQDLINFGNNLRAERNRRKLSQEKLAELSGLQMRHISLIENGKTDFKFSTLLALMEALNLKFEQLYDN